MARVAILIVTYNSAAEIGGCLEALLRLPEGDAEILVIDNASSDNTCEEVRLHASRAPDIGLIANPNNVGFAAALNQGVRATTAPLILSLNPDAHLICGLDVMSAYMEKPGTGAVGGALVEQDGRPQVGFMARNLPTPTALVLEVLGINRLWPGNPANWHYRCLGLDLMTPALVDQPAGAFLMFSRAVWEKVGGWDEQFRPIWFEDVDFCARVRAAGHCIYWHPGAIAKHSGSHAINGLNMENRERYWYGSLLGYAAKHYRSTAFRTICAAVALGAVGRAVRGFPRTGFQVFAVYGSIVGLALSGLLARRNTRVRVV